MKEYKGCGVNLESSDLWWNYGDEHGWKEYKAPVSGRWISSDPTELYCRKLHTNYAFPYLCPDSAARNGIEW